MKTEYLFEFVKLANTCQFQETAEQLGISQPVLAKHIKAIEKEIGSELFIHSTRRMELSETGRAFLPYALQIAELQEDYTDEIVKKNSHGAIRIGSDPVISMRQAEIFFSQYLSGHPTLHICIDEYDKNELRTMLRKGKLDMAICCRGLDDTDSEFCCFPYYEERIVAALSMHHPLANKEILTVDDLKSCVFVQIGSMNFAQYLDPTLPTAQYRSSRAPFAVHMLNHGNCVALLLTNTANAIMTADFALNLTFREIAPSFAVNVDILCLKSKKNAPVIQEFAEFVRKNEEVIERGTWHPAKSKAVL